MAHRALADVITTYGVFEKLLEPDGRLGHAAVRRDAVQGGKMGLLPANPAREPAAARAGEIALETAAGR